MKNIGSLGLFAAACFCAAGGAQAATQGTASTTSSTASFTLSGTGPTPARLVQVLNVSDPNFTNTSRAETSSTLVGVTMAFCVVDTYSSGVQMTVSTANPTFGGGDKWTLKTANNETIGYDAQVTRADLTTISGAQDSSLGTFLFNVAGSVVVNSTANCGGGNLKFHATLPSAMPETLPARTYSDTLTFVVTPL